MRKLILLGCIAATASVNAAVITPETALQRAINQPEYKTMSTTVTAAPVLVYTETIATEPAAYVFDKCNGNGYMVVSADDEAIPLLGYADNGTLDVTDMPDGLKYWLSFYAAEIENMRNGNVTTLSANRAVAQRSPIAPMVETRWNQSSPFNNDCPLVGTSRTVTGCVATAMAQVMKYHNWPAKGTGSHSYTWNSTTLSLDYSTITYDWENMLNEYTSSATAIENAAVANLMYSCGVAVDMNYGVNDSGAVSMKCGTALVNYFNYDASLRYLERDYYSLTDWEDEVYKSIADGYPVLYGGQSNSGGHEFVCDGYSSDGYFHFNWGWGGMSDGYFKLTSLNPGVQGIGGAGNGAGFNYGQDIIVGIKPYAGQSTFTPLLVNNTDFAIGSTSADLGTNVSVSAQFSNQSYPTVTYTPGLAFTDENGNTVYQKWIYSNTLELQSGYGYTSTISFNVKLPSTLADGVYTVSPAFLSDGTWYDIPTKVGSVGSVTMTVSNGVATFTTPTTTLPEVTDYTFVNNTLYSGMAFTINATFENSGSMEYYGPVYGIIISSSGNKLLSRMQIDLQPSETQALEYGGTIPTSIAAGSYQFAFVVPSTDGYTAISEVKNITVEAAPASTKLTLGDVTFVSGDNHVPKDDLGVKTSLTCTSGAYYGTLDMVIFQNISGNQWGSVAEFPSEMLYLDAGDTANIVYHSDFSNGNVGQTYLLMFYHGSDRFSTQEFIVLDNTTGIDGIAVDGQPEQVELYNLNGQRVADKPTPGHYIMVRRAADGTTSSQHFIIR